MHISNGEIQHEFREFVLYPAFASDIKMLAEEILKQATSQADKLISDEGLAPGTFQIHTTEVTKIE